MKERHPKASKVVAMPRPKGKKPPSEEDDGHSEVFISFGGQRIKIDFQATITELLNQPAEVKQMPKKAQRK